MGWSPEENSERISSGLPIRRVFPPEENTYYGEFNDGIDRIGVSYFTTDDTKLVLRLEIGIAPDSITKEAEVEVTQDELITLNRNL